MKSSLKELTDGMRERYQRVLPLCGRMDDKELGTKKWFPDKSTEDVLHLSMISFFLYLASADGRISDEETEYINSLLGLDYTLEDYKQIADKAKVEKETFTNEVPIVIRAAVEYDNEISPKKLVSEEIYGIYKAAGVVCMLVDENISDNEYDRIRNYLEMIYKYMEENLTETVSEKRPAEGLYDLINPMLDESFQGDHFPFGKGKTYPSTEAKVASDPKEQEEKTLEELLDELNSLTGLDEVKYDVISLINLVRIREIREDMGLTMPPISLHLVFSGNPGTGKTTVARLLAQIYHKIGILSKGQLIEVDRSGMVAGYVGQTALKVKDVLEDAKGGVLFIDEAYALTPENSQNDYGLEAIDTLVKGMEDCRDDLIVIVAGYTEPMERFIQANPGLKSRFNKFINFRDYTPEELVEIFQHFCSQSGYRVSRPGLEYIHQYFTDRVEGKAENFANAREARNLFEFAIARQANRVITETNPSEDVLTLLKESDISGQSLDVGKQQFLLDNAINALVKRRNGIPEALMETKLDELEWTNKTLRVLNDAGIWKIGSILDYMDEGKNIGAIPKITQKSVDEIYEGLRKLEWDGSQLKEDQEES